MSHQRLPVNAGDVIVSNIPFFTWDHASQRWTAATVHTLGWIVVADMQGCAYLETCTATCPTDKIYRFTKAKYDALTRVG